MRIAHCIHGLGLGGAQKVLETLVTSLRGPRYDHFVYCSLDGPVRAGVERAGASVRILTRQVPKLDPLWVAALSRAMKEDRIDLVHTHLFGDSLHGLIAARRAGNRPVIATLHSDQTRFSALQQTGYRWILPRCAAVVACAKSVGASFVEDQPELSGTLTVISNGIAPGEPIRLSPSEASRLRTDLGLNPDSLVILSMGRFVREKGYHFLIEAFSALPDSLKNRSQLLLLGTGPLERELKSLTRQLKLSSRVLLPGFRSDVQKILEISDLVVFSSLWEGLSIALLEAMAASKAIVATDIAAFNDALEEGTEAILVSPADTQALSTALQRLLRNESEREELGRRACLRFSSDFTASKMIESYEKIYKQVLSRGKGSY